MKYLSKNIVIGLIFLSSTYVFADASAEPPAEPEGFNTKEALFALNSLKTAVDTSGCTINTKSDTNILEKDIKNYQVNQKDCAIREDKANTFCMESRNPDVKQYLVIAQVLMGGVSGMSDACSKFAQVMDAGNKMLTGYMALCSSWRGYCNSACGAATKNIKDAKTHSQTWVKNVKTLAGEKAANPQDPEKVACGTLAESFEGRVDVARKEFLDRELKTGGNDYKSVAKKLETCQGYAKELASAGVGLLGMAKSFGQANQCDKSTSNTAPTPVDCTVPENKQNNMTCICQDAPRTQGCNSGLDNAMAAKGADSLRSASTSDYTPATSSVNPGVDGGSGGANLASKSDTSGGGLPGAPAGGKAAGIDGGSGTNGGAGSGAAAKASGLNTNILGGEGGGGGGGGRSGTGYGVDGGNSLRQYLPGGIKDPTALAGQGAVVSKEVTSQGGKSNWEKVRERYRDNKPSLLGY